ncbi:MAG: alpha/beta fold hydrolase [Planctomycetota bacterium]
MARRSYRVNFTGGSGFQLAGIVDKDDSVDAAPVAVFSHCFTCNKDLKAIVRISRGLAEAGLTVLRFDMTGLGGSEGDFSETNFTSNVADLHAAIEFASDELGPVQSLIGHSFGGAASLHVASTASKTPSLGRLSSLVTLAAPSDTRHLGELLIRMSPEIESVGEGNVTIGGRTWLIKRQMVEDFFSHDLTAAIPKIETAALILHSPIDETVHYDHAVRIQTLLNTRADGPILGSLVSLIDADHLLARNSDDLLLVTDLLSAFIRRRSVVGGR